MICDVCGQDKNPLFKYALASLKESVSAEERKRGFTLACEDCIKNEEG